MPQPSALPSASPSSPATEGSEVRRLQSWPWWPLLPLYPYGHRPTLVRELIPGRIWCFEQLHGIWYVAVPIRMTVIKVEEGLLLYAPIPPTAEVLRELRQLEGSHGPVVSIVLPTASGLEHKIPVPAMGRAFPSATIWLTQQQWSFPLRLPPAWLGFPPARTRLLDQDGQPHPDQLQWIGLGPLELGLGSFVEAACFDRATGSLLVTDALVSIPSTPPPVFDLDPLPLLFHARERGDEPLNDGPEQRAKGWMRMVLFASYLRPQTLQIPPWREILTTAFAPGFREPRLHFGLYPFRWLPGWQAEFEELTLGIRVAPVLERLVFPRTRDALLTWIRQLASVPGLERLISAHHGAPQPLRATDLELLASRIEQRGWPGDQGSMRTLASIDRWLLRSGLVPPA